MPPSVWPKRFIILGTALILLPTAATLPILIFERLTNAQTAIFDSFLAISFLLEIPGAFMVFIAAIPWALDSPLRALIKYGSGLICVALLVFAAILLIGSYLEGEPMYWLGQAQIMVGTSIFTGALFLLVAAGRRLRA